MPEPEIDNQESIESFFERLGIEFERKKYRIKKSEKDKDKERKFSTRLSHNSLPLSSIYEK
ncbi:MAG: hypothetical protein AB1656_13870 [Candidatus Omnitrophota bacterium]